jgi:hypothetical protein
MFRALKSGEPFVEEGMVAVMWLGKSLCYGCCKEEEESSSRRRLWCWFLFQKRGENETADIRTEHYGGTTQVRRLKLIYRGSEGGYTG